VLHVKVSTSAEYTSFQYQLK